MSKGVLRKDSMYIESDKIASLDVPAIITGEFHVDKDNHIINKSDNKH